MNKLVTLKLKGSFNRGFAIDLTIAEEQNNSFSEINGELPPNLTLSDTYKKWRGSYRNSLGNSRIKVKKTGVDLDVKQTSQELSDQFNQWLSSPEFATIKEECLKELNKHEQIRFLIRTDCDELQQLPWHKWELIENLTHAEVGIGLLKAQDRKIATQSRKINILVILGNSEGIDIEEDRQFLANIPDAQIKFLVEPERKDINDRLWEQPWDILFFSGHSETKAGRGKIAINKNDSLSLEELQYGLKKAIAQGLQLAVFNSCDGLGLARELQKLFIPQVIVMREPVPDTVAQQFLKYFLDNFVSGKTLYQSVREAREQLQGMEDKFPCASWLPVIGQNALSIPQTWNDLKKAKQNTYEEKIRRRVSIGSFFLTALVILIRELGLLQGLELAAYDQLIRGKKAFNSESPDERIVVITIDDKDIKKQKEEWNMNLEKTLPTGETVEISLADSALSQLLQKITPYQPRVVGLDIKRDFVATDTYLQNQLANNKDLFVVCKGEAHQEEQGKGVASPPELKNSRNRVGFSDVAIDEDNIVRRYLWSARFLENSPCLPSKPNPQIKDYAYSFSFLIAKHNLENIGKPIEFNPIKLQQGILEVKKEGAYLKPWRSSDGGFYRRWFSSQEAQAGFQVPLNYRATKDNNGVADQNYSLSQVLDKNFNVFERNPEYIKDKIVLIGVTATSRKDNFLTPFSRNSSDQEKTWGVYIHAHMISQIISSVEDGRPFLTVWSKWQESIWIFVCGSIGVILIWRYKTSKALINSMVFAIISLITIHIILFLNGLWIPIIPALIVAFPPLGVLLSKGKGVFQNSVTIKPNN